MMAPRIAASESAAQLFHKTVFSGAKDGDEDEARFSSILGEVDPSVVYLVSSGLSKSLGSAQLQLVNW